MMPSRYVEVLSRATMVPDSVRTPWLEPSSVAAYALWIAMLAPPVLCSSPPEMVAPFSR
jgi:hypothetical protein